MYNKCTGERCIIIERWAYLISCIDGTSVFNQQVGDLDMSLASRVVKTILPILEKYFTKVNLVQTPNFRLYSRKFCDRRIFWQNFPIFMKFFIFMYCIISRVTLKSTILEMVCLLFLDAFFIRNRFKRN